MMKQPSDTDNRSKRMAGHSAQEVDAKAAHHHEFSMLRPEPSEVDSLNLARLTL